MRIPVTFGPASPGDALLIEGEATAPAGHHTTRFTLPPPAFGHIAGCTCCTPRGPVATALIMMFRDRAVGNAPFFERIAVLASPAGNTAVHNAINSDLFLAAKFVIA